MALGTHAYTEITLYLDMKVKFEEEQMERNFLCLVHLQKLSKNIFINELLHREIFNFSYFLTAPRVKILSDSKMTRHK